ncbi:MAG: hypothetical protein PUH10_06650 [Erysipelotrichaceae bacterium]|nr:hypothetical protein [Erysipelotrichaceae bacterium]
MKRNTSAILFFIAAILFILCTILEYINTQTFKPMYLGLGICLIFLGFYNKGK